MGQGRAKKASKSQKRAEHGLKMARNAQVDSDSDGVVDTWQSLFGEAPTLCDGLYDGHVVVTDQGITEAPGA